MKSQTCCFFSVIIASLILSGCGGGGSSSDPDPAPPPTPTPVNSAPTVASANANQTATVGVAFSYDATQSGTTFNDADNDTLTYRVSFSPDSNGFTASNGQLSGTPQDAETTTVTITADDGNGGTVDDVFTIDTIESNSAPTVASANADQTATVGVAFSYDATQSGTTFNDADNDTLTYRVSFSPDSNGFTASNGQISGTPQDAETTTVTITADDGNGGTVDDVFTIESSEPSTGSVTISGRVTFDSVPHQSSSPFGLDYGGTVAKPARGVTVRFRDEAGNVLASGKTDNDGNYALEVASNTMVRLLVFAELAGFGADGQVQVTVADNTHPNTAELLVYGIGGTVADSGNGNSVRDLHATSGWDGSSYTSARRLAAPFTILDNIFDCMQLVRSVDSSAVFEPLVVFWSENNRPTPDRDLPNGELGGKSFFRQVVDNSGRIFNQIFILGAEDVDTDEYDRHVIVHEWGHYFEANFSRNDSIGGAHGVGDRLDMRVAFSEGWGTALAAMVLGDTNYRDAIGSGQRSSGGFDIESNTVTNPAGWYNEDSMSAILYDLFDSNNESPVDTISLGFAPIYQLMTNQQRTTPLFTSILLL